MPPATSPFKCPACKNDMMVHNIQLRRYHWHTYAHIKQGFALVCPSDPGHNVDLLFYDVWI